MIKPTLLSQSLAIAFGSVLVMANTNAMAQSTDTATTTSSSSSSAPQRITVTGSSIKRVDAETAVPVTVIKAEELKAQGVNTVEQAMQLLGSNQSSTVTSSAVGSTTTGASFANMRGLGANKTLVLLNGRRLANNALDGSAVDLNTIPFAAIQRIEVLRDGASALYGTDAVGGVINFITRSDMHGGEISLEGAKPQHAGGGSYGGSVTYGFGDLEDDGFNIMAVLSTDTQNRVTASERSFGKTGYIPSKGLSKLSSNTTPANYAYTTTSGDSATAAGGTCTGANYTKSSGLCGYDYSSAVDLVPYQQHTTGYLKGTLNLNPDNTLTVEYFASQSVVSTHISPNPYSGMTVNAGTKYYPGGSSSVTAPSDMDTTQDITAYWRDMVSGQREDETTNTQQRLLVSLDGNIGGWDYSSAIAYNQNRFSYWLTHGYTDYDLISAGLADGTINPFGDQDATGLAYIKNAAASGKLMYGMAESYSWDGRVSRELVDWFGAGRKSAISIGAETRHESTSYGTNADLAEKVVNSTGIDPNSSASGSRDVVALYSEFNLPVLKSLDFTAALRDDHYSDFGNTVNPKLSMRFQPLKKLLFRAAFTKGFRAPSLYELNAPNTYTNSADDYNDPVNCPGGTVVSGKSSASACDTQFIVRSGGNSKLSPEKSQSITFGMVVEPINNLTVSADAYWIRLQHQIGSLDEATVFNNYSKYSSLFHYNTSGNLSVSGADCPGTDCGYVDLQEENLGGLKTSGVDLSANYRLNTDGFGRFDFGLNGTYVFKFLYQNEEGGEWFNNVGTYGSSGPVFRWQHTASVNWVYGDWSVYFANRFKSSYTDQNATDDDAYNHHKVGSYSLWDISMTWNASKALALTGGVRNIFDTNPPYSNQGATFQQGYDPRYTDSLGRTFFGRVTYKF